LAEPNPAMSRVGLVGRREAIFGCCKADAFWLGGGSGSGRSGE